MAGLAAARQLADITAALDAQLHSLNANVDRLKECKDVLISHHEETRPRDKGTQADDGPTVNPLRHVRAAPDMAAPFVFQAPTRRINWKQLRAVDPQQLLGANDAASAMGLFEDVAYGDTEQGSIYERSEANLMQLLQLAQLQLQYLHYKLEEKLQAEQVLEDDALALAAGLSSLTPPSLTDITSQLRGIGANLQQLGCSRVEGLIGQVRAEERSAAKAALAAAIDRTKQQVTAKHAQAAASEAGAAAGGAASSSGGVGGPRPGSAAGRAGTARSVGSSGVVTGGSSSQ